MVLVLSAVRVAVDALGGDRAPEEVVAGALEAAGPDIVPILHGPEGLDTGGLELVVAPERIEMDEKPAEAVRAKPRSSLVATCRTVGEGRAEFAVQFKLLGQNVVSALSLAKTPETCDEQLGKLMPFSGDRPVPGAVIPAAGFRILTPAAQTAEKKGP